MMAMYDNPYSNNYMMYRTQPSYQQPMQLNKVNGFEGAKAFPMGANSQAPLFDINEDVFYLKTTDSAGYPIIDIYDFKKREPKVESKADFVTREEFEELKGMILNGKQHLQKRTAKLTEEPDGND